MASPEAEVDPIVPVVDFWPRVLRRFVLLALPLLLLGGLLMWLLLHNYDRSRMEIVAQRERGQLLAMDAVIRHEFAGVHADLQTLAATVAALPVGPQLAEVMREFSVSHGRYDQVRLLSMQGMELLRVNLVGDEARVVAQTELQDKSRRPYFLNSLDLQPGQIHVSPLELNIEHGLIERPFKPVVRFSLKVFAADGQPQGVLVLNYLAGRITEQLERLSGTGQLVDGEGHLLFGPGLALGDALYERPHIALSEPELWKVLTTAHDGQVWHRRGLYLVQPMHPLEMFGGQSLASGATFGWRAVSFVSHDRLVSLSFASSPAGLFVLLLLLAGLLIGLWLYAFYSVRDQGRRQEALRLAREREEEFRNLVNAAPGGILVCDEHGIMVHVNRAAEQLFGYQSGELNGKSVELLLPERLQEDLPRLRDAYMASAPEYATLLTVSRGELSGRHSTGREIALSVSLNRIRRDDRQLVIASITDIRSQKEHERQLRQARDEVEAASQAKSVFVASMSHEIRTPMNAVLGMLELVQQTRLDEAQLDYICKAEIAARSLLAILNDILDFSKIEAGKLSIEQAPFRIDDLLHALAVVLAPSVGQKPVEILIDSDPSIPAVLKGDGLRLQQVLLNLAGNAVKFTEKGEVVLSLRLQRMDNHTARVHFEVSDTGIGIAPDRLDAIFEGFSQAEDSTARCFGGTGLGLTISQQLVELMGGSLEVESIQHKGSRFWFELDLMLDDECRALALSGAPQQPLRALRVLVVDDNAAARDTLVQICESFGWLTWTAASGFEAIEQVERAVSDGSPFDLICMDWVMPGMDGLAAIHAIRGMEKSHEPVILMVSARDREQLRARISEGRVGPDGCLMKPITPSMLLDEVSRVARQGTAALCRDTPQHEEPSPLAGLRILLAEDNPLNQQVAQEMLERAGAAVVVVENGEQAIAAWEEAPDGFDVLLMDVQMPVLNGYAAARRLRELGASLPIIAMTANALASDRRACLQAGMNEHIAKPIDSRGLINTLLQQCGKEVSAVTTPPMPVIGIEGALHRLGDDAGLYVRLARRFPVESDRLLEAMAASLASGDLPQLHRQAHSFKGMSATLGLDLVAEFATVLESAAEWCDAERLLGRLREAVSAAIPQLLSEAERLQVPRAGEVRKPAGLLLAELDHLLAESNLRSLKVFEQLCACRDNPLSEEQMARLGEPLAQMDLAGCRKVLTSFGLMPAPAD